MTCLFASIGLIMAQDRQITGTVVSETGEPLAGAYVMVEGTDVGAVSDENGAFRVVNVPAGAEKIVVSMLGMKTAVAEIVSGRCGCRRFRCHDKRGVLGSDDSRKE